MCPQPAKNSKVSFIIKIIIIIAEKYSPYIKTNFLLRMSVSPPPPFSKLSFAAKKSKKFWKIFRKFYILWRILLPK